MNSAKFLDLAPNVFYHATVLPNVSAQHGPTHRPGTKCSLIPCSLMYA